MSKTSIACIAFNDNKVLIAHRNPTGQMGGRWEFPGGKVEDGESEETAVAREFKEEFGVSITVGPKIATAIFKHNGENVMLNAHLVELPHNGIDVPFVLTEHTEYRWAELPEIPTLNFVDSDMMIYSQIVKYFAQNIAE